jgi:SAM-dependent methyltransferase
MFQWYRSQVNEHGLFSGTKLFVRVAWGQSLARAANKLLPPVYQCPCCGWEGRRFYDYLETGYRVKNVACPGCDSHSRHRAFHLWLANIFQIDRFSGTGLIFAPERALNGVWGVAEKLRLYHLDIVPARGVDLLGDIQRLPFKDDAFSFLWCHHVLEQVPDDFAAMRELRRVLQPVGGVLVVSAGLQPRPETIEFGFSDKRFSGNHRSYGQDFPQRLAEAGFAVETVAPWLAENDLSRFGIKADEMFFVCRKSD